MDIEIIEASKEDIDFILKANREIDKASNISTSLLKQNIWCDFGEGANRFVCLLAKIEGKYAGMIMFSRVYWADRGEGIYVSQAYVVEEFRKNGVLKKLIISALNFFKETKFITLLVAKDNKIMQKCVKKLNFECEDMQSYVINRSDITF